MATESIGIVLSSFCPPMRTSKERNQIKQLEVWTDGDWRYLYLCCSVKWSVSNKSRWFGNFVRSLIKELSSSSFGLALLSPWDSLTHLIRKDSKDTRLTQKVSLPHQRRAGRWHPTEGAKYSQEERDFLHRAKGKSSLLISNLCCNVLLLVHEKSPVSTEFISRGGFCFSSVKRQSKAGRKKRNKI